MGDPHVGGGGRVSCRAPPSQVDRMVALSRLRQSGAFLTTSESLVLQLLRDSSHPRFRQVRPRPLCVATPPYFNGPRPQAHLAPPPQPHIAVRIALRARPRPLVLTTPTLRCGHAHKATPPICQPDIYVPVALRTRPRPLGHAHTAAQTTPTAHPACLRFSPALFPISHAPLAALLLFMRLWPRPLRESPAPSPLIIGVQRGSLSRLPNYPN